MSRISQNNDSEASLNERSQFFLDFFSSPFFYLTMEAVVLFFANFLLQALEVDSQSFQLYGEVETCLSEVLFLFVYFHKSFSWLSKFFPFPSLNIWNICFICTELSIICTHYVSIEFKPFILITSVTFSDLKHSCNSLFLSNLFSLQLFLHGLYIFPSFLNF